MAKFAFLLSLLLASGCAVPSGDGENRQPGEATSPATATSEGDSAKGDQGGVTVDLARLPDSLMGDAATNGGILEVEASCLYLRTVGSTRYLIALTIPGARWDAAEAALVVPSGGANGGGGTFRVSERVTLGGSEGQASALAARWVDAPGPRCDTRHIWVTNSISSPSNP
jgi:hypothetical protein